MCLLPNINLSDNTKLNFLLYFHKFELTDVFFILLSSSWKQCHFPETWFPMLQTKRLPLSVQRCSISSMLISFDDAVRHVSSCAAGKDYFVDKPNSTSLNFQLLQSALVIMKLSDSINTALARLSLLQSKSCGLIRL